MVEARLRAPTQAVALFGAGSGLVARPDGPMLNAGQPGSGTGA